MEKEQTPDSVVIVSGGMAGVTLLHHLIKNQHLNPALITFLYGQKHSREVACATENAALLGCKNHLILDLAPMRAIFESSALVSESMAIPDVESVLGDPQPPTYVPNRNMIFLALAVAYAESLGVGDVYYGAQRHDQYGYWDVTPQFVERVNEVYRLNRKTPIQIKAPFLNFSKADILRVGLELDVDYGKTWSCYPGQDLACGTSPPCSQRLAAFKAIGMSDPVPYAAPANS